MEILLSQLSPLLRKQLVESVLSSDRPVRAVVTDVKANGVVTVSIGGEKITLSLPGMDLVSGADLFLVFSKDEAGRLQARIVPGEQPVLRDQVTIPPRLILAQLLNEIEELVPRSSGEEQARTQQTPAQVLAAAQPLQERTALFSDAVKSFFQAFDSMRGAPNPAVLQVLVEKASDQLSALRVIPDAPAQVRMKMAQTISLMTELTEKAVQVQAKPDTFTFKIVSNHEDTPPMPRHVPFDAEVVSVKQNGATLLALPSGDTVEIRSPLPLTPGSLVKVTHVPAAHALLFVPETDHLVREKSAAVTARIPAPLLRNVIEAAVAEGLVKPGTRELPAELAPLAEKIHYAIKQNGLGAEAQEPFIRSVVHLYARGIEAERIQPVISLYREIATLGKGLSEVMRELQTLVPALPEAEAKAAVDILRTLEKHTLFQALEIPEQGQGVEKAGRIKFMHENSGLFFEQALFKGVKDHGLLARTLQNNLKAAIYELISLLNRNDARPETKERLLAETSRLLTVIEAFQVKASVEGDSHHMVIPLVHLEEEKAAYVTIKKRGKKKPVDSRNAHVKICVSPRNLGGVESDITIADGVISIRFLLEQSAHTFLFTQSLHELKEPLGAAGYKVGSLTVGNLFSRDNTHDSGAAAFGQGRSGFDVTV
ncbi:MAG: hypothetical protein A2248_15840 [Candidatus Raymondbacteria bacterium RIFOXYA2_FULL_49_16]|uniref:Flagellar hook-length control protein-like C-terminal domain-containing protein n=1 Tax=Candidatus Raymondbacteria bacterium RIFOXYD12_FULL_49_13 TaxID=1817890 RepID=A0A1F7FLP5_UNCRA|nr:MAG: hypothetical protein A2248_15840 [Candidatus Raymondbacteria bacterium RIFOXYA2_FULL_49_16]OGJ96088.1 MAG: hypothetical protein A2453_08380 [Candidatus Raymondbacteria bacterium RIFOXYC2_FULL_50_21]OGK07619.1 MAG: hypothetical protein A2519_21885 [Candidatus Raymondbacteria bacterium RIFOXYD12_FULL_49_13]OGP40485.1 MAG: hypothetical protein A2324_00245 [Candidatus Raymondbacteria bacterium RIFOXYB2_FULL_49_35]